MSFKPAFHWAYVWIPLLGSFVWFCASRPLSRLHPVLTVSSDVTRHADHLAGARQTTLRLHGRRYCFYFGYWGRLSQTSFCRRKCGHCSLLFSQSSHREMAQTFGEVSLPFSRFITVPRSTPRLMPNMRTRERVFGTLAVLSSLVGGAALILLAVFDTKRYVTLHRLFLLIFMLGVVLSALFTIVEVRPLLSRLHHSQDSSSSHSTDGSVASLEALGN